MESSDVPRVSDSRWIQLKRMAAMIDDLPTGSVILDSSYRIVRINAAMRLLIGNPPDEPIGVSLAEWMPVAWPNPEPELQRVLRGETVVNQLSAGERRHDLRRLGDLTTREPDVPRYWSSTYYPIRFENEVIGIGVMVRDVTEREHLSSQFRKLSVRYELLTRVSALCDQSTSPEALYGALCDVATGLDDVVFAWVGVVEAGEVRRVAMCGVDEGYLHEAMITAIIGDPYAQGPGGQTALTGSPCVVNDIQAATVMNPWKEASTRVGFASVAALPLKVRGEVVALLGLYSTVIGTFNAELVETLSCAASLASAALELYDTRRSDRESREITAMRDFSLGLRGHTVMMADPRQEDCPIVYASPSFETMTGYQVSEILGRNCRMLQGPDTDPETIRQLSRAVVEAQTCEVEILNYKKNGEAFWNLLTLTPIFDAAGVVSRIVAVQSDITNQRRLESQLLQSQKLEAIATLAGGIAHDINNLLLVVQGYSSMLISGLAEGELQDAAHRIQDAVQRGAEFTKHLLAYSRQQVQQRQIVNLNEIVAEALRLMSRSIRADVRLTAELSEAIGLVSVDPSQIQQIVMNLIANATDAMPDGGTLHIRTTSTELEPWYTARHTNLEPGPYLLLEVTDDGDGMDEATVNRIYDPFFTTKDGGTGLGLASVFGIVQQSNGHIYAYSEVGCGTTFKLYFPELQFTQNEVAAIPLMHPKSADETISLLGDETILVVDDHPEAKMLLANYLKSHGYRVLQADDGPSAMALAEAYEEPIDAVITDVIMPGMNGKELAQRLRQVRPDLKVIFTSGYPSDLLRRKQFIEDEFVFIDKPYQVRNVTWTLRRLLDR